MRLFRRYQRSRYSSIRCAIGSVLRNRLSLHADDWDLVRNGSSTALFVSTWVNDEPAPAGDLSIFTTGGSKDDLDVPLDVLDALDRLLLPKTVAGLYELANRGLAGELPNYWPDGSQVKLTLSDINFAVNSVNVGFDGCRFFLGCRQ